MNAPPRPSTSGAWAVIGMISGVVPCLGGVVVAVVVLWLGGAGAVAVAVGFAVAGVVVVGRVAVAAGVEVVVEGVAGDAPPGVAGAAPAVGFAAANSDGAIDGDRYETM